MTNPINKITEDIRVGEAVFRNEDIPRPAAIYALVLPELGFTRDKDGKAVQRVFEVLDRDINGEIYSCTTGRIVALGDLAFHHRDDEELRGKPWLGTWPKVGDRVAFRDGGVADHRVMNGIDFFTILDEDIRLILNENVKTNSHMNKHKPEIIEQEQTNGTDS